MRDRKVLGKAEVDLPSDVESIWKVGGDIYWGRY